MTKKKALKTTVIVILAVIVIFTALSFIPIPFNKYWKSKSVLSSPITKIRLLSYGYNQHFGDWVEFSDEDLIQKWVDYFNSIGLQHNIGLDASAACAVCSPFDGAFYNMVTLYTENSDLTLTFYGTSKMQFGNGIRLFSVTGGENPFDETYKAAQERQGLVRPE